MINILNYVIFYYMKLQPKNYRYTHFFKTRFQCRLFKPKLKYGDLGLILHSPTIINARRLDKIKLKLKRSSKKRTTTFRRF